MPKKRLTERQELILSSLVEFFIKTGSDVSSFDLMKYKKFPFSSATLRSEFLQLSKEGYLVKSHFASGRIPTIKALHYYINRLMQENEPDFYVMVKMSQRLFRVRFDIQKLLRLAMQLLYNTTSTPVFVSFNNVVQNYRLSQILKDVEHIPMKMRDSYMSGFGKLLDIIEDGELLNNILAREYKANVRGIGLLSGKKLGWDDLEDFIFLYTPFKLFPSKPDIGYIGAVGYVNMNYNIAVPAVRGMGEMLSNLLRGW